MKEKLLPLFIAFFLLPVLSVHAAAPRMVQSYGDWDAYVFEEDGKKVCYMASRPKVDDSVYAKRGEMHALLTHRPSENSRNVFSYIAGYSYKPGTDATLQIDDKKFVLFTQDDTAWAPNSETDEQIAEAIRNGKTMVVRGTSARDTVTTDTYSLVGSSKAYQRMSKECGY